MVPATIENMRKYERKPRKVTTPDGQEATVYERQPIVWSPGTGEQFSATPGDYWNLPDNEPLTDSEGEPMLLVFEVTTFIDADEYDG